MERKVDLILDEHEVARSELAVDASSGIGHYEHLNAQCHSYSNRRNHHFHRVSLVRVVPACLQQDRCPVEVPGHIGAAVSFDARRRKTRDFLEGHRCSVAHLRHEVAEPGAENHLHRRGEGQPVAQEIGRRLHIHANHRPLPAQRIIPATVAVMNAAIEPAIIARRPKRERSCLRDGAIPPMPPS